MPLPNLQELIAGAIRPVVGDVFDFQLLVRDDPPAGDDGQVDDPAPEEAEV